MAPKAQMTTKGMDIMQPSRNLSFLFSLCQGFLRWVLTLNH